jgi:hypothetical protein
MHIFPEAMIQRRSGPKQHTHIAGPFVPCRVNFDMRSGIPLFAHNLLNTPAFHLFSVTCTRLPSIVMRSISALARCTVTSEGY